MPFDPFAAAFYLVSRYEEYLPFRRDQHGRFTFRDSVAWQQGFLKKPVVNIWAQELALLITKKYPEEKLRSKNYHYLCSLDIDAAYAIRHKGMLRNVGAMAKELFKLKLKEFFFRMRVLLGKENDPFDTFAWHLGLQRHYDLEVIYFILFADYGPYDKNIHVHNRFFQVLIKSLADTAKVGIHPSYASNGDVSTLRHEASRLSKVLNREIEHSRQHFLKLEMPRTYRNLLNLDIGNDYSMGFAGETGFRAGICDSFNFYDLELEHETPLRIHPFAVMDGTLCDYKKLSPHQAEEEITLLINEVKRVKGTFVSLWHNESLSNQQRWKGWLPVYESMVKQAYKL